jgi:TetR/AcrR family transcriptional repressor of nem operon
MAMVGLPVGLDDFHEIFKSLLIRNRLVYYIGQYQEEPMARPREFEVDQALRDAAEVFRAKGYHAASLDDLIEGTGLAKGSLYKAFHDKKTLFLEALDLYARESRSRFEETLNAAGSPLHAIRNTLVGYIERMRTTSGSAGCLITNTAVEVGRQDEEISAHVRDSLRRRIALFEGAVRNAQNAGEIDPSKDPRALAEFLELVVQGLRVGTKTAPDEAPLLRAVEVAMRAL